MLLPELRREVLEANLDLVRYGLVVSTFGNASGVSRKDGLLVIKPSGVPYEVMKAKDLVVTDLDGKCVEGKLRPSSDLPTHAALYRAFPEIGGIAHTHSEYATAWAQARTPIPCLGTTHADYFQGEIPVTEELTDEEINAGYEANTGKVIVRAFSKIDPMCIPGVLVANHAPFTWAADARKASETAWMLELVARMAYFTVGIRGNAQSIGKTLQDRHFLRKHGQRAYYGQVRKKE
jgi:L-ribulose-5-phosphate 4-epimerase